MKDFHYLVTTVSEKFRLPILVSAVLPRDDDCSDVVDGFNIQMAAVGSIKQFINLCNAKIIFSF